jgi:hypothetical protein
VLGLGCDGKDWIVAGAANPSRGPLGDGIIAPELIPVLEACPSAAEVLAEREGARIAASVASEHVGSWRGTLQGDAAASFPSVELELALDDSGAGALRFEGSGRDPGEVDPTVGYLCAADDAGVVCGTSSGFVSNFSYPLAQAQSRAGVLSFAIDAAAPWDGWCRLHSPVPRPDDTQACGYSFGARTAGEPRWSRQGCSLVGEDGAAPIDCALLYALERCQCARDTCFATEAEMEIGLTLAEDGTLAGSLWYENENDAAELTLRRVP